jgi:hypothetical protein
MIFICMRGKSLVEVLLIKATKRMIDGDKKLHALGGIRNLGLKAVGTFYRTTFGIRLSLSLLQLFI